jgi:hypothetical protein
MAERRVWIAQMLCPNRHCIAALIGEADDEAEAARVLPLQTAVDAMLAEGGINPWCGICGAERASWRAEWGRTRFRTMAEAEGPLQQNQRKQLVANALFGTHGQKPPGKPN